MTEDVGTTKRKHLTPRQRLQLFEFRRGRCCICFQKISGKFIVEHWRALGLGGENDADNLDITHPKCAAAKTKDDMARINKAKAQKRSEHRLDQPKAPLIARNDLPAKDESKGGKAHRRIERLLPERRGGIAGRYPISAGGIRKDEKIK